MATPHKTSANAVAREYLRVSRDRSGRERSPDEQHRDHQADADERGWSLGTPYRDVGSASRYATKARDGYDRLIKDLGHDRFGADILMIWEGSRGSRRVGEWVLLIDLCEERGVGIFVHTHDRLYDLTNAHDRANLLDDAIKSELASAETSKRARRAAAADARDGKPHGRCPFGYQRRYDPTTRKLIAQEPHPEEAEVVRDIFRRLVAGHALHAIAQDLERRGVRTRTGKVFSPQHVRALAINPAYAGIRVHDAGRKRGSQPLSAAATTVEGVWPGIVSKADFLAVQRILTAPERKTTRPGRGVHLLSMIAKCGVCGGLLSVALREHPQYRCQRSGHVLVAEPDLDTYAEEVMLGYLARDDVFEAFAAGNRNDAALLAVRDEVASIRAERADLAAQVGSGRLSAALAAEAEPVILRRLRAAEARERDLSTPSVLTGLITPGKDVAKRWQAAPMSARRAVARLLLSPDMIGELRVTPTPTPGAHCEVSDRVVWRRG